MTATPKSIKSESLNGSSSWVDIDESPYHNFSIKNSGRESKNSSFEKIMMDVQNELIAMSMSSGSCKDQLEQINKKLSSKASEQLQVDSQFKLDQLENFEDERLQNLNSDYYWYWGDDNIKNFPFDDDKNGTLNLRQWAIRRNIFSKEVLSLLVLSNVVSVVLGVGIGLLRRI